MILMSIRFTTNLCRIQRDTTSTLTSKNINQVTETVSAVFGIFASPTIIRFKMMGPTLGLPEKGCLFQIKWNADTVKLFTLLCVWQQTEQQWIRQNICATTWESGRNLQIKLIWFIQRSSSLQTKYHRYHTVVLFRIFCSSLISPCQWQPCKKH